MSSLHAVLDAIKQAEGPVSTALLARELDIEASAVEGMIEFWVRKGRLRMAGEQTCAPGGACGGCSVAGEKGCPLLVHAPRRYEIVQR